MPEASRGRASSVQNFYRVSRARLFIRALGVSFFSVLSVLIALYAFTQLPQVQDILLDAQPWTQEVIYWSSFYVIGIFVWALPLVFTARLLLLQNFDRIGIDTEERFRFYIFIMPRFFAVIAFIAVLLGMISASANLPLPQSGNIHATNLRKLLLFHLIILSIATLCITAVILMRDIFISFGRRRMEDIERSDPEMCEKMLMNIESFSREPCRKQDEHDVHLMALKPDFLTKETWIEAQRAKLFMWMYMFSLSGLLVILIAIHFLSYSDAVRDVLSSYPRLQAAWNFIAETLSFKRAVLLLVLLGAWLPFLTILSLLSNRHQFPFIAAFIIAGVIFALLIGDGHNVRVATLSNEQQAALKPIGFADALKDWKAASGWNAKGCEQLPAAAPGLADCPRPIIVAGEGGGSRAAFLLASVLGALEDDSLDKQKNPTARPFHQQLFAISSVSGSSVGAAFFVSALKVQPRLAAEKLRKALNRQRLWFPNVAAAKPVGTSASGRDGGSVNDDFPAGSVTYKDTLQAALSHDFVSPVLAAYFARDMSQASLFPSVMDRAGVLETAWEDAFDDVYGTTRKTSPLSGPLQAIAPGQDEWMPLLFMNATSMGTGRRVIITPVKITEPIGAGGTTLFADAYDLHELMCAPYQDPVTKTYPGLSLLGEAARALPSLFSPAAKCNGKKPTSIDIRLSTAASVSSRSPFVSPHAVIRNRRAELMDSVVDGGYFDNSGIVTALEIAQGVKVLDARLSPFILQVSSEPAWFESSRNCAVEAMYPARPKIPDETGTPPLSALSDLLTVMSTRVTRGYETILGLPQRASQPNGGVRSAAQIHVCPEPLESFWNILMRYMNAADKTEAKALQSLKKTQEPGQYKSVSLSWWLSPPLQAYLDGQIYNEHNLNERNCVISLLKDTQCVRNQ